MQSDFQKSVAPYIRAVRTDHDIRMYLSQAAHILRLINGPGHGLHSAFGQQLGQPRVDPSKAD
ncbi:hypothetical protein D3C76_1814910 [compost metagenome]